MGVIPSLSHRCVYFNVMRDRVQRRGKDFSETTAFGVKELETLNTHQYKHERTTALYHDARGAESMMVKA
jgi:hypothetical protein